MSRFLCERLLYFQAVQSLSLKSFSTAVETPLPSFTVQYLINSCGLPSETALSAAKKLHLEKNNVQRPESVIALLKSYGFSRTHIGKIVSRRPELLQSNVDHNLKPKVEFFLEMGFSSTMLWELIASNPHILKRSLSNQLKPSFDFLNSFLQTNENVIKAIRRFKWLLTANLKGALMPNLNLLVNRGVPISCISKLILTRPRAVTFGAAHFVEFVERVENLGILPRSPMFCHALRGVTSMSNSSWKGKLTFLKSLGWSEEEIMSVFKGVPYFMSCSEDKIQRAWDFFVNTLKVERSVLIMNPRFLLYGMDKRILPRHVIIQLLNSKKLLRREVKLLPMFRLSEKKFVEIYVIPYVNEVPGLMEMYCSRIAVDKFECKGEKAS